MTPTSRFDSDKADGLLRSDARYLGKTRKRPKHHGVEMRALHWCGDGEEGSCCVTYECVVCEERCNVAWPDAV